MNRSKKLGIQILLIIGISILLNGCKNIWQEEDSVLKSNCFITDTALKEYLYGKQSSHPYPRIRMVHDGILHFDNYRHFEKTYHTLLGIYDLWNDNFIAYYADKNFQQLDSARKTTRFNCNQPLMEFEFLHQFSSLRSSIDEKLKEYYKSPEMTPDPESHPILDDVERTLFNVHGEIMIGDTIYHYKNDGSVIKIVSFDDLALIRSLSGKECKNRGFKGEYCLPMYNCFAHAHNDGSVDSHSQRLKWYISFRNLSSNSSVVFTKIISETRNPHGQWERSYSELSTKPAGKIRNHNHPGMFDEINCSLKCKKRTSLTHHVRIPEQHTIASGELYGYYKANHNKHFSRFVF